MLRKALVVAVVALTALHSAASPPAGAKAPAFELADQHGRLHALEDYRGRWVVLFFYQRDGTPECTVEACGFRDQIAAFRRLRASVLGVSLDDRESHQKFAERLSLPYPLLADETGSVALAYGVHTRKLGAPVARRQTFLIDPSGRIVRHYVIVDPEAHSGEVLADLETLATAESR